MIKESNEENPLEELGLIFILFIFLSILFEIGLLIFGFIYADKVECNLLWCTFTSGDTIEIDNSYSNIIQSINSHSECFINNKQVNCSEINQYTNKLEGFIP